MCCPVGGNALYKALENIKPVVESIHVYVPAVVHYAVLCLSQEGTGNIHIEQKLFRIRRNEIGKFLYIVGIRYVINTQSCMEIAVVRPVTAVFQPRFI